MMTDDEAAAVVDFAKMEADALVQLLETPHRRAYVIVITMQRDAEGNGVGTISRSSSTGATILDAQVVLKALDRERARVDTLMQEREA